MKFYILRNNDYCIHRETYIFKSKKELKKDSNYSNGDFYDFCLTSKKKVLDLSRTDYEFKAIDIQLTCLELRRLISLGR